MTWLKSDRCRSFVRRLGVGAFVAMLLALAACAPVRPRASNAALEAAQRVREQALSDAPDWSLSGRIAVSANGQGGSGRIEWRQRGDDFDIRLSAPVTGQGWRLVREGSQARLEGLAAGPQVGPDAGALLEQATGWRLPVAALSAWVRGARAPGAAAMEYDTAGLPATLQQFGWDVEYRGWGVGSPPMPAKVFAQQGDARVRLVIDRWETP